MFVYVNAEQLACSESYKEKGRARNYTITHLPHWSSGLSLTWLKNAALEKPFTFVS